MTEVRFYADEHVSRAVVLGLRQRGVDVLTVGDCGLLGGSDEEHMAFALKHIRCIITQDTDFLALATGRAHAGIVYAPQQTTVGVLIRGIMLIHQLMTAEEMAGLVEFL
jgi:hypothetical protein